MARILIAGFGDIGFRLGLRLAEAGHQVAGVRRKCPEKRDSAQLRCISADLSDPATFTNLPDAIDQIVYIVSPDERSESAYQKAFIAGLKNIFAHYRQQDIPPACLFVSSSSVYGQNAGEWVDEDSPTEPSSPTARILLAAEKQVLAEGGRNRVVRFTGIYGSGRNYLVRRVRDGKSIPSVPPRYTNRIHCDDCIGVLSFLLEKQWQGEMLDAIYLASDDKPVLDGEATDWIAEQLGIAPRERSGSEVKQYQNKRCSNRRLKALGYRFQYPGYREGYADLLAVERQKF